MATVDTPSRRRRINWSYDDDHAMSSSQEGDPPPVIWPAPSRESMEKRQRFRSAVQRETSLHRRIHPHDGMSDTGRNVCLVLRDRERYGARHLVLHQLDTLVGSTSRSRETSFNEDDCFPSSEKVAKHSGASSPTGSREVPVEAMMAVDTTEETGEGASEPAQPKLLRRVSYPLTIATEVRTFGEYYCVTKYHSAFFHHLGGEDMIDHGFADSGTNPALPTSSRAISTISIAFSPDSKTMASTHGDHTVKITCCNTGRLLESLDGHPRTPWTVKYHPVHSNLVASGCLGHQVRIWDWQEKQCLHMIRLESAIISLSFHPTGQILAIANGTKLHFWGYNSDLRADAAGTAESPSSGGNNSRNRGVLTEVEQRHMLRCVHFPPGGDTVIVGGVNPNNDDPRRRVRSTAAGGGMSFYLRLWDFDLGVALRPLAASAGASGSRSALSNPATVSNPATMGRRAISNPRTFVPRALLYNDGGFDVSPDGKTLCACAEYWLPHGVDNAMELLQNEEADVLSDDDSEDGGDNMNDDGTGDSEIKSPKRPIGTRTPTRSSSNTIGHMLGRSRTSTPTPLTPQTPPPGRGSFTLSPPSPPGRRVASGLLTDRPQPAPGRASRTFGTGAPGYHTPASQDVGNNNNAVPPPPPQPGVAGRPPHPLSVISSRTPQSAADVSFPNGRYVPHVVTISLDTSPVSHVVESTVGVAPGMRGRMASVARGYRPRLGQLLEACPLDGSKASAVTCVKFSPSTDFCLIGYGVREPLAENGGQYHPVTSLYRIRGGMTHVSTMLSGDDDVNIARFHPDSGYGFVYGTKQGRVRVLAPRPWNYYTEEP